MIDRSLPANADITPASLPGSSQFKAPVGSLRVAPKLANDEAKAALMCGFWAALMAEANFVAATVRELFFLNYFTRNI